MKTSVLLGLAALVPALLFANVLQGFRFEQQERAIATLQREQRELFEENKRAITGIAMLRSPTRLREIAIEDLELERITPERILTIELPGGRHNGDGAQFR